MSSDYLGFIPLLFILAFAVLMVVSMWRIFEKAGKPGWACIVPIYNLIVFVENCKKTRLVGNFNVNPLYWFDMEYLGY